MTVKELSEVSGFLPIALPEPTRVIDGVYIGDLLSWVMGRAKENDAWITIMSNINVIAVASLADVSVVIFAEDVTPEQDIIDAANLKGINLISVKQAAYDTAIALNKLL